MESENRYLNEKQVDAITGRSVFTLRNDRAKNQGIPYVKNGRQVRYSLKDVIEFMEKRKVQTS
jgi:hypothetical protein